LAVGENFTVELTDVRLLSPLLSTPPRLAADATVAVVTAVEEAADTEVSPYTCVCVCVCVCVCLNGCVLKYREVMSVLCESACLCLTHRVPARPLSTFVSL